MKKQCITWMIAAIFCLSATAANAIEFNARGTWTMGFGAGDISLINKIKDGRGNSRKASTEDGFVARQRVLLQLDAVASDQLMGSVMFKIGPASWGKSGQGAALGADGTLVRVDQAYLMWTVPNSEFKFRMGIQAFALPNAAGGSAVFDTRSAAITGNYSFNDNVGLTTLWMRPFNDNYAGGDYAGVTSTDPANYLDNMDLFALMLPMRFEGLTITPWAMYGMQGRNTTRFDTYATNSLMDGYPAVTLSPYLNKLEGGHGLNITNIRSTSKANGAMFWAGLPVKFTSFEPWNIEFDVNYGYVDSLDAFDVIKRGNIHDTVRGSTQRQGWLAKMLVEYKMDWGTPGILGWYASGDDGNVKNGSERMPSICPYGNFTSFFGDGNLYWGPAISYLDKSVSYAGSWGLGAQVKDISIISDLKHLIRAVYWGGTNSPAMVKYMDNASAWDSTSSRGDGPYLTTNDGMLELNFISSYKVYENLELNFELSYAANFIDDGTWKKSYANFGSYSKQDAWKGQLILQYTF